MLEKDVYYYLYMGDMVEVAMEGVLKVYELFTFLK